MAVFPRLLADAVDPTEGTLGPIPDPHEVRELALVLSSMGVPFTVQAEGDQWIIRIPAHEFGRALETIRQYRAENRDWPPRRAREKLPYERSLAAPLVLLALVALYAISGPAAENSVWFSRGEALNTLIVHGEIWRAVTALTLHADAQHVLGNALSGSLFLSALNRRLGDGRGPLLALTAGTLGNVCNALWHTGRHASIGASTAVFSTVGLLVATQLAVDRHGGRITWVERVAPLLGGLALLGALGASQHSDLFAHGFGFAAGLLAGVPFIVRRTPLGRTARWVQWACGLGAAFAVAASWCAAFALGTPALR